ncbi:hypothetical protein HanRHA438_Chr02g0088051 [Helianthus annuus]|nr:hypothetical protein HanRHA438_Chr02g0088051 [Helianthus annuus]
MSWPLMVVVCITSYVGCIELSCPSSLLPSLQHFQNEAKLQTYSFVLNQWKMKKCIIGFNELVPPHIVEVLSDAILESLIKWGIQGKIGTITLDNASNYDEAATI